MYFTTTSYYYYSKIIIIYIHLYFIIISYTVQNILYAQRFTYSCLTEVLHDSLV